MRGSNLVPLLKNFKSYSNNQSACHKLILLVHKCENMENYYRSGTVNSKSFVSKVLLRIKWKFELINAL